jgi:sporulation protein YlmC with PRC-barrel domain
MRFRLQTGTVKRLIVSVVLACLAAVSVGATGTIEEPDVEPIGELNHRSDMRITDLFGTGVFHDSAPRIGTVADVLVDIGQGSMAYLVVRFSDDSIRSSDELFPIPTYLFEEREDRGVSLLLRDETFLSNMPTLEEITTQSPAQQSEWDRWVYSYWNTAPATSTTRLRARQDQISRFRYQYASGPQVIPSAMLRATELIDTRIRDSEGRAIGRIDDAVVSVLGGRLLLLNMRPTVDATEDNYLIPLAAFTGNRETNTITYDIDEYGLTGPSGFSGEWPDITSEDYHSRLARFWNARDVGTRYGIGMPIVPLRLTPVSVLSTYSLFTRDSRSPGQMQDVIVNPDGSVDYAIVEFGNFLDIGGERSAVPVSMLTVQQVSQAALLSLRTTELDQLPRYPSGRTVDTGAEDWDAPIRRYWNNIYRIQDTDAEFEEIPTVRSPSQLPANRPLHASAILELTVVSEEGEEIGSISELYVDMADSRIGLATLQLGNGLFGGGEVPIPISALRWNPQAGRMVLAVSQDQLEEAPGYNDIPQLPGTEFLREFEAYWSAQE